MWLNELILKKLSTTVEAMRLAKVKEEKSATIRKSHKLPYNRTLTSNPHSGGGSSHTGVNVAGEIILKFPHFTQHA